jgi:hypothetical protein
MTFGKSWTPEAARAAIGTQNYPNQRGILPIRM